MRYLSRLTLEPEATRREAFFKAFESSYRIHQEIWRLFADRPDRRRDFLYRLDATGRAPNVMTLSRRPPEDPKAVWRIESKEFRPRLAVGDPLRFSLRANPVVTRDGKRHDVVMQAKLELRRTGVPREDWPSQAELVQEHAGAWLEHRAEKLGFKLESVIANQHEVRDLRKPGGRRIRHATCNFEGVLRVLKPETFICSLNRGIGPAKAFGCGLMLCTRASARGL